MSDLTCSVAGCDRPTYRLGMCMAHRARFQRYGDPRAHVPLKQVGRPLEERFWEKAYKTDSCWIWTGGVTPGGYGKFGVRTPGRNDTRLANRVAWELTHGPIPDGLFVLHDCDMPPCVNPDHLHLGTALDNMVEMRTRGRNLPDGIPCSYGEAHPNAKLTEAAVDEIRQQRAAGVTVAYLAATYGVSGTVIRRVARRIGWVVDAEAAQAALADWAARSPARDWVAVREAAIQGKLARVTS